MPTGYSTHSIYHCYPHHVIQGVVSTGYAHWICYRLSTTYTEIYCGCVPWVTLIYTVDNIPPLLLPTLYVHTICPQYMYPNGYTLFSTVYVHCILHPRDMVKSSTGYAHWICHPQDMSCRPRDMVSSTGYHIPWTTSYLLPTGYTPQDSMWSTVYAHRIYLSISCGCMVWTYPVDYISRGRNPGLLMTNQPTNQPTNHQPTNQPTKQSLNESSLRYLIVS